MTFMYFSSFADFIAMGGYGFYVWLAFGFAIACLLFLLVNPVIKHKRTLDRVREQMHLEKARAQENKK